QGELEGMHAGAESAEIDGGPVGDDVVEGVVGEAEVGEVEFNGAESGVKRVLAGDGEEKPVGVVSGDAAEFFGETVAVEHRVTGVGGVGEREGERGVEAGGKSDCDGAVVAGNV